MINIFRFVSLTNIAYELGPGIKEVKIVLVDSYWSEKQQKIRSLDSRYMAIWNMSLEYVICVSFSLYC